MAEESPRLSREPTAGGHRPTEAGRRVASTAPAGRAAGSDNGHAPGATGDSTGTAPDAGVAAEAGKASEAAASAGERATGLGGGPLRAAAPTARRLGERLVALARKPYWDPPHPSWVIRRWPDLTACLVATFFFWLSLTPSLVPRPWYYQGAVGGITAAIGYGLGALLSWIYRLTTPARWQPSPLVRARCWLVYLVALPWAIGVMLGQSADLQRELRRLQELPPTLTWHSILIALISLTVLAVLLLIARALRLLTRLLTRLLGRVMPWPLAVALGLVLTSGLVVVGTRDVVWDRGVLGVAESWAKAKDSSTDPGVLRPYSPLVSGSPDSLIAWEDLGNKGRTFTGTVPSAEEITRFSGAEAMSPIRAYVGRAAYEDFEDGAQLAVRELERTGAFDRAVLAVTGTTGTGWVNPTTVEALEFMYGGDTAIVTMQYSYMPSWASFMVERNEAGIATEALFDAVYARWEQEPADDRPRLLVFGESLSVAAVEESFDGLDDMIARTDGALLIGPPDYSPIHSELTDHRDPGSPVWRPVYDGGRHVRFAQYPKQDLRLPPGEPWQYPRIVYLQNASDPVVWWSFDLLFQRPQWLNEPLGPDVTSSIDWFPFVTFWQTTVDMAVSYGAPAPHGHRYGANPVAAWAAIAPPEAWTEADTDRLSRMLELRHPPKHGWAG